MQKSSRLEQLAWAVGNSARWNRPFADVHCPRAVMGLRRAAWRVPQRHIIQFSLCIGFSRPADTIQWDKLVVLVCAHIVISAVIADISYNMNGLISANIGSLLLLLFFKTEQVCAQLTRSNPVLFPQNKIRNSTLIWSGFQSSTTAKRGREGAVFKSVRNEGTSTIERRRCLSSDLLPFQVSCLSSSSSSSSSSPSSSHCC